MPDSIDWFNLINLPDVSDSSRRVRQASVGNKQGIEESVKERDRKADDPNRVKKITSAAKSKFWNSLKCAYFNNVW